MNSPTTTTQQAKSGAEQGGAGHKGRDRQRKHSDDRGEVATGVFDHGRHRIILCRPCWLEWGFHALGEHVIQIKHLAGGFITDVRIIHTAYIP
jgi:hypothetical protein